MSDVENVAVEPTEQSVAQSPTPAPAEDPAKVEFNDEQQKIINSMEATRAFESRKAKREASDLRRQIEEANSKLPQETQPDVPEMPDPYEENFNDLVIKRDEAIRAKERFDSNQRYTQDQQQQAQQQAQRKEAEELNTKAKLYESNAVKKGLNFDEVKAAGQTVIDYGLRGDVINEMLSDADGALMSLYMSKNPQAIDSLNSANPITLGSVYADIRAKASALGVQKPTAPDPTETLRGSGIVANDGGPDGATYE